MRPSSPRTADSWPPDYLSVWQWRQEAALALQGSADLLLGAKEHYGANPEDFINHWCDTYDPRLAGSDSPARMPFILFPKQSEFLRFLQACLAAEGNGLVEKSRDMGATWLCAAFSVWLWLFRPESASGWGSRKEDLVDRIGDPKCIFEKMRLIVMGLPRFMWPVGFRPDDHMTYMKFINPETGATITGEAGDNIGRGGRTLIYFKDESAHYTHPEKIEAALGDNTRVQIDISSVNGLGNVFHRAREAGTDWLGGPAVSGRTNVFVLDWRDHPEKTQAWYEKRRSDAESKGLLHVFAQEVDRNYAASVEGVIIPAEWVKAAIGADEALGLTDDGPWGSALDVADGGGDRNAQAMRKGIFLKATAEWGERDTGATARRAVAACEGLGPVQLQYDSIGVGAGVKAETNRLGDEGLMPEGLSLAPWNAAAAALDPDEHIEPGDEQSPLNKDFYANLKAQGWWQLRRRFERTWRAVNEPGFTWNAEDLIVLPADLPQLRQIEKELSQPTAKRDGRMRLVVDKMPEGTRSPNVADAIVMAFWPAPIDGYDPAMWARLLD